MALKNNLKQLSRTYIDIGQAVGGLHIQGRRLSNTITTAQQIGKDNICRIVVTAPTYITFGPSTVTAPSGAVSEFSVYLPAGIHYILATDDYIIGNLAVASIELLEV